MFIFFIVVVFNAFGGMIAGVFGFLAAVFITVAAFGVRAAIRQDYGR
jgi:hypothetical protein